MKHTLELDGVEYTVSPDECTIKRCNELGELEYDFGAKEIDPISGKTGVVIYAQVLEHMIKHGYSPTDDEMRTVMLYLIRMGRV